MKLPIFQSELKDLNMMQTRWAAIIEPPLSLPTNNGMILQNVILASGDNTINHLLGRKLQGWYPVRFNGGWAQLYDKQDTNTQSKLTLILNASAGVTVDLFVF